MKKIILLLLLPILVVACGPSQSDYNALKEENATLKLGLDVYKKETAEINRQFISNKICNKVFNRETF